MSMILSHYTLKNLNPTNIELPGDALFDLPERVLQFGTGVLLRGLPDYFIDKANRNGIFNGRVVVVKSTDHGNFSAFDKQDGLYTICTRGTTTEAEEESYIVNSCISRVLSAKQDWDTILKCAHNPAMQIIISNTTEAGIELVNDDISRYPPSSFPGKLLSFLYERYKAFDGSRQSGMVIVPTELVVNNGRKLEAIVLELAHLNDLEASFIDWLEECNYFCNSLVDRIVPGTPDTVTKRLIEADLGYADDLMIMTEAYALWAIEGDEHIKKVLAFAEADERVLIEPDIHASRELKLRLLNGTHTLSCGLAFLSGCSTVSEAMQDEALSGFIAAVMQNEITPTIPGQISQQRIAAFRNKTLERFSNTAIQHSWLGITTNYSFKIRERVVPLLLQHYTHTTTAPELLCVGFAAYILFMRPAQVEQDLVYGECNGKAYLISDSLAVQMATKWNTLSVSELVEAVCEDPFWEHDLSLLPGFVKTVCEKLRGMMHDGVRQLLEEMQLKKVA